MSVHTNHLFRDHSSVIDLLKGIHLCTATNASRWRETKIAVAKSVESRLSLVDAVEEEISGTSLLLGVKASIHPPVMALSLTFVDMKHVDIGKFLRSECDVCASDRIIPIRGPLGVVHGPAVFAGFVHNDHLG